jgi:PIN domain nuclease of toxin-antitoxin system
VLSPYKLSDAAATIVQDPSSELMVSAVSLWEASLKYNLGKLAIDSYTLPELYTVIRDSLEVKEVPLTVRDAISIHELVLSHHRDPFDRMLIWQAIQGGYTLITKDKQIWKYEDVGLKWLW